MTLVVPSPIQFPVTSIPNSTFVVYPPSCRSGIFYVGDVVSMTLAQLAAGRTGNDVPNAYTVRDVPSGVIVGGASIPFVPINPSTALGATITPVPAAGGNWAPGYYRGYLTGTTVDSYHGNAYGVFNFAVFKDHGAFLHFPSIQGDDTGNEGRDVTLKGILGMGGSRLVIQDVVNNTNPSNPFLPGTGVPAGSFTGDSLWSCLNSADEMIASQPADPARETIPFMLFPNGAADVATLAVGYAYVKNGVDGSQTYVGCGPGTNPGTVQVTVRYPNNTTIVETWNNYASGAAAAAAINASSAYIRLVATGGTGTTGPTLIGNLRRQGVINTVQYLYPHGVKHYEGPQNEGGLGAVLAENMRVFWEAVHSAGFTDVVAMGPCPVGINDLAGWQAFFDAGGGQWLDAISTHMYTSEVAGDMNSGRSKLDPWFDLLKRNGQSGKKIWCTESTQANGVGGILFQPGATRQVLNTILLLEQRGVPRSQNLIWYDRSHGFWGVPNWLEYGDGSIAPHGLYCRVMAEETLGMPHHHTLDFGSVQGNRIFLGSVFKHISDGTQTAMVLTPSKVPNATITFGILGTVPTSFTVVDGRGVVSTFPVVSGTLTIPIDSVCTYIRIPSGTSLYVSSCLDWGANPPPSISQAARARYHGTDYKPGIVDNVLLTDYGSGTGFTISNQAVPDTADAMWSTIVNVDRVIVFAGIASQPYSTLTDFDVETTADGVTWVARKTITIDVLENVFVHPCDTRNSATTIENYWDAQYVFPVSLGATYACKGIRLNVRGTTYGGMNVAALGPQYGNGIQNMVLQEISVPSPSAPSPFTAGYVSLVMGHAGLLGFWRMGETFGIVAKSEINSPAVDGTWTVTTQTVIPGPISDGTTAIKAAGGWHFGVPANSTVVFGDTFSIGFWHNSFGGANGGQIFQAVLPTGQQIQIIYSGGKSYTLSSSSVNLVSTNIGDPADGNWHYIVFTKTGSAIKAYVDGKDVTGPTNNVTFANGLGIINMLAPGGASSSFADLDINSTVLTPAEIIDRFNAATIPAAVPALDPTFFAPSPVLSGSPFVGEQLQCSEGFWRNAPTKYQYQYQTSANGTTGWTNISGALRSDFLVDSGKLNLYVRCQVTASNIFGTSVVQNSNVIGPIVNAPAPILNSSIPILTGVSKVGNTLTCSVGGWTGSTTVFYFQWQLSSTGAAGSWSNIIGATTNTFPATVAQQGLYLRCGVRAEGGSLVYTYSGSSAPVEAFGPAVLVAPSISGSATVPSTLISTPGLWDG